MTDRDDRWIYVGATIAARMKDLSLTKAEVQRAAGISDKTLNGYISGKPIIRADKKRGLCEALRWSTDSIDRLLEGDEPIDLEIDQAIRRRLEQLLGVQEAAVDALGPNATREEVLHAIGGLGQVTHSLESELETMHSTQASREAAAQERALAIEMRRQLNVLARMLLQMDHPRRMTLIESFMDEVQAQLTASADDLALAAEGDQGRADEVRNAPRRSRPRPE